MDERAPQGLYDPAWEHDSCGFGLIAQIDNQPSRELVDHAFEALRRMSHRGGVSADGLSGDGCGVLLYRPTAWLLALADEAGIELADRFASGLVFFPRDNDLIAGLQSRLEARLLAEGLTLAGWREVPINEAGCGPIATASRPEVRQVFVDAPKDLDELTFERRLFRVRRLVEKDEDFAKKAYLVSLSAATIGYKAMATPGRLREVYPDLQHPALASSAVVFHQRYSTNTLPQWSLAQPFRVLAHNGEINTIRGNRNWMRARSQKMHAPDMDFSGLGPLISQQGSDSQSLDSMIETLLIGGFDMLAAVRITMPPAWQAREDIDEDLEAFYEYYDLHSEPWDGPAGVVLCDNRYAACVLDRNGLRPARWMHTADNYLIVASEAGLWDVPANRVLARGQLGPGEMIAVDLQEKRLLDDAAVDAVNRARAPFKAWLRKGMTYLEAYLIDPTLAAEPLPVVDLRRYQKLFCLSDEEQDQVLKVLAEAESEAIGSMGDDTPIAVLSQRLRSPYEYCRQAFAQVTNPPIDPLRERLVMSLSTQIGAEGNLFVTSPDSARQVMLNSPILSQRKLRQLRAMEPFDRHQAHFDLAHAEDEDLESAIVRLCDAAELAVRQGAILLLLTDRHIRRDQIPIHALLATGAIHARLVDRGLRCDCNLIVETATTRNPHHYACLIGFGATAIYPWLAYQSLFALANAGQIRSPDFEPVNEIGRHYRRGVCKGLLKILSKSGIATVTSYRGAQLFELLGLDAEVVDRCFPGTPSRIGGTRFADLDADQHILVAEAWEDTVPMRVGGAHKYMHDGESHMYNPDVVNSLQRAVRTGDFVDYMTYAQLVQGRAASTLRDLLHLRESAVPYRLEDVEPASSILKRFDSAGMSLGALSPEAHESLAIAMNRLGGRSNSGEGGEDPLRYGTERMSKIKQVASGRFGVTPAYLVHAEVLQIKIAQGAKPGEGGQLPGHKVNALIARLRYARPGIGLISPPPHHDIYSIEDLAQLIYDLKEINPQALVSVKLVAHAGVGTVAAGVAKAGADLITISGHDGGTGASPLSSIHYAGVPWELGLAETHQTLCRNGLRKRVILQTDGGLKTGLDVIKAAILGADSFGFGTAPMISLGCKYLRNCHLNNCATGIATQNEVLRSQHFSGSPEGVMNFFSFVAEETRMLLSKLGLGSLGELVGRTDLLTVVEGSTARQHRLDLTPLLAGGLDLIVDPGCIAPRPPHLSSPLAQRIIVDTEQAVLERQGGRFEYAIANTDRSIGARLSGEVARRWGNLGMSEAPIELMLHGSAGQSLGAWNAGGVHIVLEGEANDYVGKGMAGGCIVVRPFVGTRYPSQEGAIIGNTCLYGATGGELFAAGRAGERFAVRNSGAVAVVEGSGDHCCEYMTGGVVALLGRSGWNFGAGMTGGFTYMLDLERIFVDRYNHELVDIHRISLEGMEQHLHYLRSLLARHIEETGSLWARRLLDDFRDVLHKFWMVKPKAATLESLVAELRDAA